MILIQFSIRGKYLHSDRHGYHGRILWVDLTSGSSEVEERDDLFWRVYGGGGLAATALLLERTPPGIDPLSPQNLLIFASSVIAGTRAPGLARFTTAAKSPLTGGIGETRTEGPWGAAIKATGFDIIAISGRSERAVTLLIENQSARILPAEELWGSCVTETVDHIKAQVGDGAHVAAIGPAGENLVRFASIIAEGGNQASRMGMGAVMGSKNLKAIALQEGAPPPVSDEGILTQISGEFSEAILANELSRWQLEDPGFSCWIYLHGLDAALCVNNYSKSIFDGLAGFQEKQFLEHDITPLPCPGCPNDCIKSIAPKGRSSQSPVFAMHQEIAGAMGPNLGIGDLDAVLAFNEKCNQYGLDPTSLGFTISCAMEAAETGVLPSDALAGKSLSFGDADLVSGLIDAIARREGFGDRLAEGSLRFAGALGAGRERLSMHVKGLEMVPFEPRSQTNLALGYAVAPIGPRYDICEHDWDFDTDVGWEHTLDLSRTLGILERVPMSYTGESKVRIFKVLHNLWSGADALDFCTFAIAPTRALSLHTMATMIHAITGWETSSYELMRYGERRNHLMRVYNIREGLGSEVDTLPERFFTEPIADGPRAGDMLDKAAFHSAIRSYYRMMGWDEHGVPYRETLIDALIDPDR